MSLLSNKLKAKTNIGKPMLISYCTDKTIKSRQQNHAQDRLLNEAKEKFESDLEKGNKTKRNEKRQLTASISSIRRTSLPTDEWLDKNREKYEKWKDREREKLEQKHSRLRKFYRCPTFTSLDEYIRPVSSFDRRCRSASLSNLREHSRIPVQNRRKLSCREEHFEKSTNKRKPNLFSITYVN